MHHDELVARIGERADKAGVLWVYFPRSTLLRGHRGFPDLVLAGPGGVGFAEVKTGSGLDDGQAGWRDTLLCGGAVWHLWRPADLWTGTVEAELARLAAPAHS